MSDESDEAVRIERIHRLADRIRITVRDAERKDLPIALSMVLDEAIAISGADRNSVITVLRKSDMASDIAKILWADAVIPEAS